MVPGYLLMTPARCTFPLHWPALCWWWKEWTGSSSNEAKCRIQRFLPAKMESRVPDPRNIPSGYVKIAIENGHLRLIYPLKMVIFHNMCLLMNIARIDVMYGDTMRKWIVEECPCRWALNIHVGVPGLRMAMNGPPLASWNSRSNCSVPPAGWMSWGPGGLDCAIFRSALQVPYKMG